MTIDQKLASIRTVGEEIVREEELRKLIASGEDLVAYDGFEPSGQIHIAQGLLRAININKMIKAGIKFKMLVADWHAMANNKMGGDLEKIKTVGDYFIEVWKASGMDLSRIEFIYASDLVKDPDYWKLVIKIGTTNKLARFIRTAEIMGRKDSANQLTAAQIIYPCMQIADIFILGAKITQLGMDQRKINMLAREIGPQLGFWKPIVISHHMLMSLRKPPSPREDKVAQAIANKMSKSKPDYAIFMTDTPAEVERKINKAYCPEGDISQNPVLEYCRYIIFTSFDRLQMDSLTIKRPKKFGGDISFKDYASLEKAFGRKELHPLDLKQTVARLLNQLLDPVRRHFQEDEKAKKLINQIKGFTITR